MNIIRYAMVVDQKRCIGCHSCAVACKSENKVPDKLALNKVETEGSEYLDVPVGEALKSACNLDDFNRVAGKLRMDYMTRSCQHCENAPCVKVCPTNSTYQREDGIVVMDTATCIGCDNCIHACPFGKMRVHISKPSYAVEDIGDQDIAPTLDNTVKKCTFCNHRVDRGEAPFCVQNCPAGARFFGDINNSASKVYMLVHSGRKVKQYSAAPGQTKPGNTYFYFIDRVERSS